MQDPVSGLGFKNSYRTGSCRINPVNPDNPENWKKDRISDRILKNPVRDPVLCRPLNRTSSNFSFRSETKRNNEKNKNFKNIYYSVIKLLIDIGIIDMNPGARALQKHIRNKSRLYNSDDIHLNPLKSTYIRLNPPISY